jgi:hypothetical protein
VSTHLPPSPATAPSAAVSAAQARRHRVALAVAGLAVLPVALTAGCGDDHKAAENQKPDPRASTQGILRNLPVAVTDQPSPAAIPAPRTKKYTQP